MRIVYSAQPIDIERLLIWTYRDQKADVVIGNGGGLFDQEGAMDGRIAYRTSADGVATIARIGLLGTRVDGGGASASHLHPDAEAVHAAVMALPLDTALLIMRHARAASRPDSEVFAPPRAVPVLDGRGRILIERAPWDKNRNYGACKVEWIVPPVSPDVIRLEYALWRRSLALLAMALSHGGRLEDHRPMMPAAPEIATLRCA